MAFSPYDMENVEEFVTKHLKIDYAVKTVDRNKKKKKKKAKAV